MQNDTDKDHKADLVVVLEGGKTAGRLAVAGQPLMVCHQACGASNREEIPEAEFSKQPDENQRSKHQDL